ncbi:UbiA family prenyltransferase [Dyadobacter sandarakinus]|nr:UbiA family prenyltransferase [Dyadobacter sandarakinus]
MSLPVRDTVRLLRIPFSFFLLPLFLLAYSQAEIVVHRQALAAFLIIHLLVYPSSNGYNSYVDRDEESIGGLERPPQPTVWLFYLTIFLDLAATFLALIFVNVVFAGCIVLYIAASRAYSSRQIRLKKYPVAGFLVVVFFQGAFTYYLSVAGVSGSALPLTRENMMILAACSFQIAGAYPLTQVYQHRQDLRDGVVTISYKLGYTGTFVFTAIMFVLCNLFYFMYFRARELGMIFYIIQVFFFPIVAYFGYWFYLVWKDNAHANFRNTMRMNWIAAVCMNGCFLVLIFITRNPLSYISVIETAVPAHCISQEELAAFYSAATSDPLEKRKIRIVAGKTGIENRYSVIGDFGKRAGDFEFFSNSTDLLPEPTLSQRMEYYRRHATRLSMDAVGKIEGFEGRKNTVTHLITVTCTGLFAPGLDIELVRELGLNPTIQRSSINFMGCNAAILALKNADAICRSHPQARVLIVCTELCSIHFQKKFNDDYLLSNLLFADGAAAVIVTSQPETRYAHHVEIDAFDAMLLHQGYTDMAWGLSETGFIMNLSSYVPDLIRDNIRPMLHAVGVRAEDFRHWAVHPGGKRIIDDFALALDLDKCALAPTYNVLRNYGNMSSPTVLFVLKDLLEKAKPEHLSERIFAAAFGPGLSIETMRLRYV